MSRSSNARVVATGLVLLFVFSLLPVDHPTVPVYEIEVSEDIASVQSQTQKLTIGSWPDGANQRVALSVPDGHSIKALDLSLIHI